MSKEYEKACMDSSYIKHLLILASAVTGCVLIVALASLVGISLWILSFELELDCWKNMIIWKKKSKILIRNKYVWYNKGNINLKKIIYWN